MEHELEEEEIIRFPKLQKMMGDPSRSTVWRWEQIGWLPKRINIGPRSVGWKLTEVKAHIKKLKPV